MRTFGIIGCGNMGGAILRAVVKSNLFSASDIIASDKNPDLCGKIQKELGVSAAPDNLAAARADCLLLAVKPQFFQDMAAEIRPALREGTLILSIVAGYDLAMLRQTLGENVHLIRIMPNTPAMVGEGVLAACRGEAVTDAEWDFTMQLLSRMGMTAQVTENLMDAVTGVSGSSPAFVFLFMEALADAGVRGGLPRATAYQMAAQVLVGCGRLALETGMHPGQLKDMVTSPAGTTIEGVYALEKGGFRAAVMDAVDAAIQKSKSFHK